MKNVYFPKKLGSALIKAGLNSGPLAQGPERRLGCGPPGAAARGSGRPCPPDQLPPPAHASHRVTRHATPRPGVARPGGGGHDAPDRYKG